MKVFPLASESLVGVRSMATLVELASGYKVLIDPGAALGPRRYGLPPHQREIEALGRAWEKIERALAEADAVVITHYHYDHFNPHKPELLRGKRVLVKHPEETINRSQRRRAAEFLPQLEAWEPLDGRELELPGGRLVASEPLPHGAAPRVGWVVSVYIEDEEGSFLFTSDVGGPQLPQQVEFILKHEPQILMVDGPLTYQGRYRELEAAVKNLLEVISSVKLKALILEHHLLRDKEWRRRVEPVLEDAARRGVLALSAAEFAGEPETLLEAHRRELYEGSYGL